MNSVPKLRVAKVHSEILGVLSKIKLSKSHVIIWQKENETKRVLNTAYISKIDLNVGVFYLSSISGQWDRAIKNELALYFKGEEESILFKAKNLIVQKNELIVPIPAEVRLLEKRNQARFNLQNKTPVNIILQKNFEKDKKRQFSVSIIDISITGVAVALSKSEAKYFYEGDTISVIEMANLELKDFVPAKIIYLKPVQFSESHFQMKNYRAGIQFGCYLTSDHIKALRNAP